MKYNPKTGQFEEPVKHEKQGRPSKYKGETKVMRVPVPLVDIVEKLINDYLTLQKQ